MVRKLRPTRAPDTRHGAPPVAYCIEQGGQYVMSPKPPLSAPIVVYSTGDVWDRYALECCGDPWRGKLDRCGPLEFNKEGAA